MFGFHIAHQAFTDYGIGDAHTVMTGLSNTYTDYVVTREEYQVRGSITTIFQLPGGHKE